MLPDEDAKPASHYFLDNMFVVLQQLELWLGLIELTRAYEMTGTPAAQLQPENETAV